ncbi:GT-D fold domain-containing glycosyltransferase [Bacteroides faecium]|uniref:DUF1792 domain-containing protein n=1 Tax=Bacteroides faecium TaxID=2715212 RepID=A0A6H0KQ36_9BACE|nr:GT-D fold domain-containing glycosyltransferase [Bacteroides faecium]QIU95141.1 DUF1792 domain-containing protein [Bacteroides faecium]
MKQRLQNRVNYILYFLFHYLFEKKFRQLRNIHIENNVNTLIYILENHVSVSRFGDGELKLLSGCDTDFQNVNLRMINKLHEVLHSDEDNHIVCLPHPWKSLCSFKYQVFEYWSSYLNCNLNTILPLIDMNKKYYDASFTRFYIDYRNDSNARKVFPLIKEIWNKQSICIIEGEYSRLGVGNDLFDNAQDIVRIICPAINAFDVYDQIIKKVVTLSRETLILIALGMTATCLAYDLSKKGYWAIDIGHVDIEYEWFRMKATSRVPVLNKYVAESSERFITDDRIDIKYESQIIEKII